jgi:hypothetical protein
MQKNVLEVVAQTQAQSTFILVIVVAAAVKRRFLPNQYQAEGVKKH